MADISNEEIELTQEFGQLVRVLTGSSMQLREAALRGVSSDFQAHEDQRQQQQLLAESVNEKLRSEGLWARQDPTEIADHVIVSAHLGQTNETALGGYAYASDMLRDNYGINLEEMNKDHPTSFNDKHTALANALDSYFERRRAQAEEGITGEANKAEQHVEQRSKNPTLQEARTWHAEHFPEAHDAWEQEYNHTDTSDGRRQAERRLVNKMVSHLDAAEEQASLRKADQYHAEDQMDKRHTFTESQTGGRQPDPYQRVNDTQRDQLNERNPGYG